jgi:LEA14-like dessication related protein
MPNPRRLVVLALPVLVLGGCALSPFADPLRVELAGLEALPGAGMELRFAVRLRIQNPNASELSFDGVALDLDLRGQRFASGVAPVQGRVPRYGETLITVPVTVSGLSLARQALGLMREGEQRGRLGKVAYRLSGKLGGVGLAGARFESAGEVDLSGL